MISSVDLSFQAMLFDSLEIVKQRKSQASRLRDRVPLDLVIRGFIVKGLVPAPLRGLGYMSARCHCYYIAQDVGLGPSQDV